MAALMLTLCGACAAPGTAPDLDDPAAGESRRINEFFERAWEENVMASPMTQSFLGIRTDYDKWDEITEERRRADQMRAQRQLDELRTFNFDLLGPQERLSYRVFEQDRELALEGWRWRNHSYPLNQMRGWQSLIPTFLINIHRVDEQKDLEAYVARLEGTGTLIDQVLADARQRAEKGILAPGFVYKYVISDARNVIEGHPFTDSDRDSPLYEDFIKKLDALKLATRQREELTRRAVSALTATVGPAYRRLIAAAEELEAQATDDAGVWKLPDGGSYYNYQLSLMTTTDLDAGAIHSLGLEEVARIHAEMKAIMARVGFDGTLAEFFEFMRTDPKFFLPESEDGRQEYLQQATAAIDGMRERLDEVFTIMPQADLEVRAVEPFRERSAGKAFYQRPAPDGTRPGVYYANLYRMSDMPLYQMEALAYHEGIPGHHMQIAIAQEVEEIPSFRRFATQTAYSEGWGLYSEYFPKEMGLYQDPYSDFGRLAMALWRACRLVVDTGMHAKRWTREQAIAYLMENTPNPEGDAVKAIERYIVMPGQATAYTIGMLKILEVRERARQELGSNFDIRRFHDAVLVNGPLPLNLLEETIYEALSVPSL
jgi:uncharacterized protein (DUF885 family)